MLLCILGLTRYGHVCPKKQLCQTGINCNSKLHCAALKRFLGGEKKRFSHLGGQIAQCSRTRCAVWVPKALNSGCSCQRADSTHCVYPTANCQESRVPNPSAHSAPNLDTASWRYRSNLTASNDFLMTEDSKFLNFKSTTITFLCTKLNIQLYHLVVCWVQGKP